MSRQLSEGVKSNLGKLGLCAAAMLDPLGIATGLKLIFSGNDIAEALLGLGIASLSNPQDKSKPPASIDRLKYHLGHEARFDLDADPATSDAVEAFFNEAVLDIAFPQRDFSRFRDALSHAQGLNAGIADAMLRRLPGWDGLDTKAQALSHKILSAAVGFAIKERKAHPQLFQSCFERLLANDRAQAESQRLLHDKVDNITQVLALLRAQNDPLLQSAISDEQVHNLLESFAAQDLPREQWYEALKSGIDGDKALIAELSRKTNEPPEVDRLRQQAAEALNKGQSDTAEALLERLSRIDAETERDAALRRAETRAQMAQINLSRARYEDAARHYLEAFEAARPHQPDVAMDYGYSAAYALKDQGRIFGGTALDQAASFLTETLLPLTPRDTAASIWASTQNLLGVVLQTLGERRDGLDGIDALTQAEAAYRHALEVHTLADLPIQWAMTHSNLGGILLTLGQRRDGQDGIDALTQAEAAYRHALEVCTRADFPIQWAMTQNNLGIVLQTLGERRRGQDSLDALTGAEAAYRAALKVRTRMDFPIQWAMTQNNLGTVLQTLGERRRGQDSLDALTGAEAAYRRALEVRTRADFPIDWAMTQNNLGIVLQTLGQRRDGQDGMDTLTEAEAAYRQALEVRTRADFPVNWAMTQENLGILCESLFEKTGDRQPLSRGIEAVEGALEVYRSIQSEYDIRTAEALLSHLRARAAN